MDENILSCTVQGEQRTRSLQGARTLEAACTLDSVSKGVKPEWATKGSENGPKFTQIPALSGL